MCVGESKVEGSGVDQLLYLRYQVDDRDVLTHVYYIGHELHEDGQRLTLLLPVEHSSLRQGPPYRRRVEV